jgi:HTH-type transcriptional regulator/antitoxin HigA
MDKIAVTNPLTFYSTIGEELGDILTAHGVSIVRFTAAMSWSNEMLQQEKYTQKDLQRIAEFLDTPDIYTYLLNFQNNYKVAKATAEGSFKKNLKIFKKVQHLQPLMRGEFVEGIDLLEDISTFLDIEDEDKIFESVAKNIALYKISDFVPDDLNLYAWLRRGQLDFNSLDLPEYDATGFRGWIDSSAWLLHLYDTDYFLKIPEILKSFGVGLIYTPYLERTVFGAVRWFDGKPLIQVSDKNKCLATSWYTLFHEFGHVVLHQNAELFDGIDQTKGQIGKVEKEANAFAYSYLFAGDGLRKRVFAHHSQFVDEGFISSMSRQFKVPEMSVAFWMKKANVKSVNRQNYLPTFSL